MKRLLIVLGFLAVMSAGAQNTLSLSNGTGRPGDVVNVTLTLDNSADVTALQAFVPLGSNLQYVPGSAALTNRSNGHELSATVQHDTLRLYSYSTQNNT